MGAGWEAGRKLGSSIQVPTGSRGKDGNEEMDLGVWYRQAASRGAAPCEGEQARWSSLQKSTPETQSGLDRGRSLGKVVAEGTVVQLGIAFLPLAPQPRRNSV